MTERSNLTETQEQFAYAVGRRKAFIGARQVGHTEALAHYIKTRMKHGKVLALVPTHRHAGDVLMPRIKELVDLDEYDTQYKMELLDGDCGVMVRKGIQKVNTSEFDAIAVDSVDHVDVNVDHLADMCVEQKRDIGVAGCAKTGPSENISKILASGEWELFTQTMEESPHVHPERVEKIREEFPPLQEFIEVDGLVLVDPKDFVR